MEFNNHGKIIQYPTVKQNQDNCSISVTFIPVVSGEHVIKVEISRGNLKSKAVQLTVTGSPQYGAKVVQGPDWASDGNASQNYELTTGFVDYGYEGNVVQGPDWASDGNASQNYQLKTGTVNYAYEGDVQVYWDYIPPRNNYYGSSGYNYSSGYVGGKIKLSHKWGLGDNYPIKLSI